MEGYRVSDMVKYVFDQSTPFSSASSTAILPGPPEKATDFDPELKISPGSFVVQTPLNLGKVFWAENMD